MAEKQLDVIIRTIAENTAALGEVTTKLDNLQVSTTKHAKATKEAAEAERDLTRDGREAAKAMGELGGKGGELFERFTALGGVMGSGGPLGIALGGALVGLGALVEGARKVDETYQEIQTSTNSLRQATDSTHQSFEDLNGQFEDWINSNQSYVKNGNEARDALASFVRAGDDAKTSMDDLGISLDLSIGKHIGLAEAAKDVILAEQGQGKALKDLGINLAELKQSDDNTTKAHKDFEAATKAVETAQKNLQAAQENLHKVEDGLAGKHKLTAVEADTLAAAHSRVDDATKKLTDATGKQHAMQDDLNKSVSTASQAHTLLHEKLDGLRQSESDQEQAQNRLGIQWEKFAQKTGPEVEKAWQGILDGIANVVGWINAAIDALNTMAAWADAHPGMAGAVTGGTPGGAPGQRPPGVRQHGGYIAPGESAYVGETAMEMATGLPGGGAWITPLAGGGGGGASVVVNVATGADPHEIAREVAWAMKYA